MAESDPDKEQQGPNVRPRQFLVPLPRQSSIPLPRSLSQHSSQSLLALQPPQSPVQSSKPQGNSI